MFHPETEYGRGMVIAHFLFLGVETDALTDDGGFGACGAPDCKGHLEADGEDALTGFTGARTEGMSVGSKPKATGDWKGGTYLPASLFADVVPSCSGGT